MSGSGRWAFILLLVLVGVISGMEAGLFTVLTLAALDAFLVDRVGLYGLWLGLAGLARPEALILAGLTWVVALAGDLIRHRGVRWRRVGFLSMAVAAGLVPLLIGWSLTGTEASSGVQTKSWLYNIPFYPWEIAHSILILYGRIAGDAVTVTLYWQAVAATDSDAKVFLHLYDAEGNLGPQSDGWTYYGTRPPYTWFPGEVVSDPRLLTLPDDLPAGLYSLEVGLYDPDGLVRLTAYRDGVRQPEDRVSLTIIEVTD